MRIITSSREVHSIQALCVAQNPVKPHIYIFQVYLRKKVILKRHVRAAIYRV